MDAIAASCWKVTVNIAGYCTRRTAPPPGLSLGRAAAAPDASVRAADGRSRPLARRPGRDGHRAVSSVSTRRDAAPYFSLERSRSQLLTLSCGANRGWRSSGAATERERAAAWRGLRVPAGYVERRRPGSESRSGERLRRATRRLSRAPSSRGCRRQDRRRAGACGAAIEGPEAARGVVDGSESPTSPREPGGDDVAPAPRLRLTRRHDARPRVGRLSCRSW